MTAQQLREKAEACGFIDWARSEGFDVSFDQDGNWWSFDTSCAWQGWESASGRLLKDAQRWRYLVAENNKGSLHGKYLICWYDEKGEGYCSTNGVSVNGKDGQAIVRIIDAAMLNALNPAREDVK